MRNVIILAAGEGKRMKSALPKVLHPLLGRSLVGHVLAAAEEAIGGAATVVVGHGGELVRAHLEQVAPAAVPVPRTSSAAPATPCASRWTRRPSSPGPSSCSAATSRCCARRRLRRCAPHETQGRRDRADRRGRRPHRARPHRAQQGRRVRAIVEERDATPAQRGIREINSGVYVFDAERLREMLGKLSTDNDQGEEYLTDVIGLLAEAGAPIVAHRAADATETSAPTTGPSSPGCGRSCGTGSTTSWMRDGVAIIDPATTWIDVTVTLARDAVVEPNTHLRGATRIGEGAVVGPDTSLIDVRRRRRRQRRADPRAVLRDRAEASVGPFAYLRPGTRLGRKAKIGTFVETKAATVGDGAKVPHLSYVGDAEIGEGTNIGAATVFVNYDGVQKRRSVIGAPRADRRRQHVRRAGAHRRRRLHRRRQRDHQGRAAGRARGVARAAAQHRGLGRAQATWHSRRAGRARGPGT